jgi:Na+-translocating ferredoxin:NAD+ oxidoreductase RnfC subunit
MAVRAQFENSNEYVQSGVNVLHGQLLTSGAESVSSLHSPMLMRLSQ